MEVGKKRELCCSCKCPFPQDIERILLVGSADQLLIDLLCNIYPAKKSMIKAPGGAAKNLRRFIRRKCYPAFIDFGGDFDIQMPFQKQPIPTRAAILNALCYFQFHTLPSVHWNGADEGLLRTEPIGVDSEGFSYWYFSGLRLYRSKDELWETACHSISDWTDLVSSYLLSDNEDDQGLGKSLEAVRTKM